MFIFLELKNFILENSVYKVLTEDQAKQPALYQQCVKPFIYDEFWKIYTQFGVSAVLKKFGTIKYKIKAFLGN